MRYEESYAPRIGDYDGEGRMFLPAVLRILEDIASRHSAHVGDCVIEDTRQGVAWFIVGWHVQVLRRPVYPEPLTIRTWARTTPRKGSMLREYCILGADGAPCVLGLSKFALFDLRAGHVVPVSDALFALYAPDEERLFEESDLPRLHEPDAYQSVTQVALRRSDIDFNAHVHNLSYLYLALEALPEDVYRQDAFTALRMVFRKAVQAGEAIECRYANVGGVHTVGIYGGDGTLRALVEME
ncbi:MAG: thioesterase [Clostridia bacterium]|nr:thioesterase [Clostridia bacterium]